MPNYFYVSNQIPGTRTTGGGDATPRTGAFSSMAAGDVYATIHAAFGDASTKPVAGDFIYVANDHASDIASNRVWGNTAVNTPVNIICVLQTDCTVASTGASEGSTDFDISVGTVGAKWYSNGVDLLIGDDLNIFTSKGEAIIENTTITFTGSTDNINVAEDGAFLEIRNCSLVWTAGTTAPAFGQIYGGAVIILENCDFQDGSGTLADMFSGNSGGGGTFIYVNNCDLSAFPGYIWVDFGASTTVDDNATMILKNCKVDSDQVFIEETLQSHGQYFLATNCANTAAAAEYQFLQKTMAGTVQDTGDDGTAGGIYRVESTAFSGTNKVSFKCATNSNCGIGYPLSFDMPARFADLTAAGTDALTVYIASAGALTTANCWIEVSYPDATNKQLWKTTSSRAADILSATALTADGGSSDWENAGSDLTTENEYKITVTSVTGAVCVPHVKFFCTVPSVTFYVDTTIDLS